MNKFNKNCCDGIYNSFDAHFTCACDNKCSTLTKEEFEESWINDFGVPKPEKYYDMFDEEVHSGDTISFTLYNGISNYEVIVTDSRLFTLEPCMMKYLEFKIINKR